MAVPRKASAYVDPGSGAMIWQILAAAFLGALFYFRKLVIRIRQIWSHPSSSKTEEAKLASHSSLSAGD